MTAASEQELPVFIRAPDGDLFGILTSPVGTPLGVGVIVLPGGAPNNTAFGRNGVAVTLARRLAARGFHVMRFDYHGLGESDGEVRSFRLVEPFTEDLCAIVKWMNQIGLRRFVQVGTCFGARTVLAGRPLDGLEGVVLSSLPVSDDPDARRAAGWRIIGYLRKNLHMRKVRPLLDGSRRRQFLTLIAGRLRALLRTAISRGSMQRDDEREGASVSVLGQLGELIDRQVPILFIFSRDDPLLRDFREAWRGSLGSLLGTADGLVTIEDDVDPLVHSFAALSAQQQFIEITERWIVHISTERPRRKRMGAGVQR